MAKEKGKELQLKITWGSPESPTVTANVFRFIYSPEAVIFALAAIDPERTLWDGEHEAESITVIPHQRYILTISDFVRLKKEVEQAYRGLREKGVDI